MELDHLETGPKDGPLVVFVHGWPELGLVWRAQLEAFARAGYHCIAPDMRGYGASPVPTEASAYRVRELVQDLVELHDALGAPPAIWVGHDWGSEIVWQLAAHHPERCARVVNLCLPYLPTGFSLATVVPLVDRGLYPTEPYGQWDYVAFYQDHFARAVAGFEVDVEATLATLYRRASPTQGIERATSAMVHTHGGWFPNEPSKQRDETMLPADDFAALVAAFRRTGFAGACSWYLNAEANGAYAAEAPDPLAMPVLFLHAQRDPICATSRSRLADPMRAACAALTEITIQAGHELMLEEPALVHSAIATWLATHP